MNLKYKIVLIVFSVVCLSSILGYGIQKNTIYPSFEKLEQDDAHKNIDRALATINREVSVLNNLCYDWAVWDDTYEFAEDRNQGYIESNLVDDVYYTTNLNVLLIYNIKGEYLAGDTVDLEEEQSVVINELPLDNLPAGHFLMSGEMSGKSFSGLLSTDKGPMIISINEILTSNEEGPSRGILIMGRLLNQNMIDRISKQTFVDIDLWSLRNGPINVEISNMIKQIESSTDNLFISSESTDLLAAYTIVPNILGDPLLLLKANLPRHITKQGKLAIRNFMLSIFVVGICIIAVLFFLLQKYIANPIASLTHHVSSIELTGILISYNEKVANDEVGTLAKEFNKLIDRLTDKEIEQKRTTMALEESEEKYRVLFERSTDAILLIEGDKFTDCNEATVKMLRYPNKEKLLQTHPSELSPEKQLDGRMSFEKANEMMSIAFSKGSNRFEWDHKRADGEIFPVEVLLTAIPYGDKKVLYVVWRDITKRKRDEDEKNKLQGQLQQAQKMESIGRLAGGVAHDFNNILTAIIGYSMLGLQNSLEDDSKENFQIIYDSGQRAAALTEQLLMFSRKQVLEMKDVDLNDIIITMEKMVQRLIGEDIAFEFKYEDISTLWGDKSSLEQIIMNLAVNARDAMPDGGLFMIETKEVAVAPDDTDNPLNLTPGSYIKITATDTGIGMSQEIQDNIFEPFYTTKGLGKGTGLGLATVYGIVKQHKGNIFVSSELGKGTTFIIYLPVSKGTYIKKKIDILQDLPGGNETILITEDEPNVRKLIVDILNPLGYKLLGAANGEEALLITHNHKSGIDLLLTDVVMPGMNGRELADQLLEWHPEIKIIYMSGYTDDIISRHGVLDTGLTYINKPIIPAKLAKIIRSVLDEK